MRTTTTTEAAGVEFGMRESEGVQIGVGISDIGKLGVSVFCCSKWVRHWMREDATNQGFYANLKLGRFCVAHKRFASSRQIRIRNSQPRCDTIDHVDLARSEGV